MRKLLIEKLEEIQQLKDENQQLKLQFQKCSNCESRNPESPKIHFTLNKFVGNAQIVLLFISMFNYVNGGGGGGG